MLMEPVPRGLQILRCLLGPMGESEHVAQWDCELTLTPSFARRHYNLGVSNELSKGLLL